MSPEEFDALVDEAMAQLPPSLTAQLQNVAVFVEDDSPPGEHVLGYYDGVPLTERGEWYSGVLPDRVVVCRNPILAICTTREQVVEEVRVTVLHEIAHHFGIDDDELHDLGYA